MLVHMLQQQKSRWQWEQHKLKHHGSDLVTHYQRQHEITEMFPCVVNTASAWSHMIVAKQHGAADCLEPDALLCVKHTLTSAANKYIFTRIYVVNFACFQAAGITT